MIQNQYHNQDANIRVNYTLIVVNDVHGSNQNHILKNKKHACQVGARQTSDIKVVFKNGKPSRL